MVAAHRSKNATVHVVVTCSDRKKLTASQALCLRSVAGHTIDARLRVWTRQLEETSSETRPAREVYSGSHWTAALNLPDRVPGTGAPIKLWVCSAGYGLIRADTEISGYSATFSTAHEDSISRKKEFEERVKDSQDWWDGLAEWRGVERGLPRSLAEIARVDPDSPILIAASPPYLRALQRDLLRTRQAISTPDQLSIVSAGTTRLNGLSEHLLPVDGRLKSVVGGAMPALNVRILGKILGEAEAHPLAFSVLRERYRKLVDRQPLLDTFDRTPMTDDQVVRFIREGLRQDPRARHTPLLRKLRDSGQACEQRRFRDLYKKVTAN